MNRQATLVPLLVAQGARDAVDWYVQALGARVLTCYEHGQERRVSHADLAVGDAVFSLTEEARAWNSDAPPSLGGSPVVLQLHVDDVDARTQHMCERGATVVFPVQELFGERMARVRDPFGHLWLLRTQVTALSVEDIQRQRDELIQRALQAAAADVIPRNRKRPPKHDASVPDASASLQHAPAENASTTNRGRVHLLLGPVGAGKSTFAHTLAAQTLALRLTLDEWMAVLYRPDRPAQGMIPWYRERAARCVEQIWTTALAAVVAGMDVVLEIGLLTRHQRAAFIDRVHAAAVELHVYVFDIPRDERWTRVQRRNIERGPTFHALISREIFDLASDAWEPVDALEFEGAHVHWPGSL